MSTEFDKKVLNKAEFSSDIALIVGTRPGIVMFSPVIHELNRRNTSFFIIHTGQHYSPNMDAQFFHDLDLPQPDYRLDEVADMRTHAEQTAAMLVGIEKILMDRRPCITLVGGDANTNLAGALAASKLGIRVGHIEAGERSYDKSMPEEQNRITIDHLSHYLFVTNENSIKNLHREGIVSGIYNTGNPIVDASIINFDIAVRNTEMIKKLGLENKSYALLTMHREENVDSREKLQGALQGVSDAAVDAEMPVYFCVHPRTSKRMKQFEIEQWASQLPGIKYIEALGYLDFLSLLGNARMVFTDSGGVQQEACIHKVPCVTLRENTEWTETLDIGANFLAGCNASLITKEARKALNNKKDWEAPFGDGHSAVYICDVLDKETSLQD